MKALFVVSALILLCDTPFVASRLVVDSVEGTDPATVDAVARACADIESTLGPPQKKLVVRVRVASDLTHFTRVTGRPAFEAAAFGAGTLWLTPAHTRERLFKLDEVYRHECVHAWLAAEGLAPLPRTLEEAIAMKLSGQSAHLPPAEPLTRANIESAEAALARPHDRVRYEATLARVAATFSTCVTADKEALTALARVAAQADRPFDALVGHDGPCRPPPSALKLAPASENGSPLDVSAPVRR